MSDSLSIRAYTTTVRSHEHDYHQIVLPLCGQLEIDVDGCQGEVGIGQSVIIQKDVTHKFKAHERSRFLVADLYELPKQVHLPASPFATISAPMQAYCNFVDTQLQHQVDECLEADMIALFKQILGSQKFLPKIDNRMTRALTYLNDHLHQSCSLSQLAQRANLSPSHFKVEFKRQTGKTTREYVMELRMKKARALLAYTDIPIPLIAQRVGYASQSAFTRRFSDFFKESPRHYRRGH